MHPTTLPSNLADACSGGLYGTVLLVDFHPKRHASSRRLDDKNTPIVENGGGDMPRQTPEPLQSDPLGSGFWRFGLLRPRRISKLNVAACTVESE